MRSFEDLVAEAEAADVTGWGFGWLDGRATEERPPWQYAVLLAERLATVDSALDLDTGGGEVLGEAAALPPRMAATEAWPPNLVRARERLGPRGVEVVDTSRKEGLPFPDRSFELVTSRHPVAPDWPEIHRVLVEGGTYLAQHVGPRSAAELITHFVGSWPDGPEGRDPEREAAAAETAGLTVVDLRTALCRMEFHDIGAVVWTLRKCVWWVPDFTVARYRDELLALDAQLRAGRPVVAHSTRHRIEARR
ncbi:class I SAM-dependent methyltransferase [Ornithinimicrobium sp. F0845]|uniref:class I SAM-dependent methyltransferase n=1 Tax=Ornithinimicrobium sp. F0845 TaxID=2926412 RepID=UPI001FF433DC|nr:methyltransferase domain-containing protein [Ornithinimicrobium sp. F0845]MCK0110578.1 class I SAM-dependent methyltransferase [Ornithinimicrobium sp. F0845]